MDGRAGALASSGRVRTLPPVRHSYGLRRRDLGQVLGPLCPRVAGLVHSVRCRRGRSSQDLYDPHQPLRDPRHRMRVCPDAFLTPRRDSSSWPVADPHHLCTNGLLRSMALQLDPRAPASIAAKPRPAPQESAEAQYRDRRVGRRAGTRRTRRTPDLIGR